MEHLTSWQLVALAIATGGIPALIGGLWWRYLQKKRHHQPRLG